MSEVASAREDHGDIVLGRRLDDLFIAHGAARLGYRLHPVGSRGVDSVAEGEKGVRTQGAACERQDGALGREAGGVHPAHLARAHAYRAVFIGHDDGVALHVARHAPSDSERFFLIRRGRSGGHDLPAKLLVRQAVALLQENPAGYRAHVQVPRAGNRPPNLEDAGF